MASHPGNPQNLGAMSVTQQPQQYIQGPPPQYQPGVQYQYYPGQPQQIQLAVVEMDLISGVLDNITEYKIHKSSKTTRYAADKNNAQLFAYSEEVLINTGYAQAAAIYLNDNNGRRFLQAEMDMSGIKVFSGSRQLGVIERPGCGSTFHGSSVLGLGSVEFDGEGCASCALTCLPCCCGSGVKFDIIIGGKKSGEFAMEGGKGAVKFDPGLDSRVKGIAVLMTFMAYNQFS